MYLYKKYLVVILILSASSVLVSCAAEGDDTGVEFSPQMYHSVPYEPLSQITDEEAGSIVGEDVDGHGEFYNSNPNNPFGMTMRQPAPNTVKRSSGSAMVIPYRLPKDSLTYAAANITSPLDTSSVHLVQGQALYTSYCYPCHGATGQGDGPVAEVYLGVPAFTSPLLQGITEGHIFHVITHGKGRMYPYGSQVSIEDRWKIVRYVQTLQQGGE